MTYDKNKAERLVAEARCKHPPDHVVIKYDCDGLPDPLELSWRECLDCGTWLPLGPSNDDDERVRVEIRAATLAAQKPAVVVCAMDEREWFECAGCGWRDYLDNQSALHLCTPDWHAGYLARCIATHTDGSEGK